MEVQKAPKRSANPPGRRLLSGFGDSHIGLAMLVVGTIYILGAAFFSPTAQHEGTPKSALPSSALTADVRAHNEAVDRYVELANVDPTAAGAWLQRARLVDQRLANEPALTLHFELRQKSGLNYYIPR
jgi:di/tricarboxylate transporter